MWTRELMGVWGGVAVEVSLMSRRRSRRRCTIQLLQCWVDTSAWFPNTPVTVAGNPVTPSSLGPQPGKPSSSLRT